MNDSMRLWYRHLHTILKDPSYHPTTNNTPSILQWLWGYLFSHFNLGEALHIPFPWFISLLILVILVVLFFIFKSLSLPRNRRFTKNDNSTSPVLSWQERWEEGEQLFQQQDYEMAAMHYFACAIEFLNAKGELPDTNVVTSGTYVRHLTTNQSIYRFTFARFARACDQFFYKQKFLMTNSNDALDTLNTLRHLLDQLLTTKETQR